MKGIQNQEFASRDIGNKCSVKKPKTESQDNVI